MRRDDFTLPEPPPNDRPGDRWVCGIDGDSPCSRGPDRRGKCPLAHSCHPQRTWSGRRRQVAMVSCLMMTGLVFFAAFGSQQAEVFKPGDLSTPHAQILDGTLTSQRCEACHPEAGKSVYAEWNQRPSHEVFRITQSDRCMECHHNTIDRKTAMLAHNLPFKTREGIRLASNHLGEDTSSWNDWLPGPAVDQENVACGACHREHHGPNGNLLDVSDTQCQTCHSQRFGSFASAHPDWGRWPYGRGGEISFNHASHANKHYPATLRDGAPQAFRCASCHLRDSNGELQRSVSFEQGCASCHEKPLNAETMDGLALVSLPSLATESVEELAGWPETATGFYDGRVTPLADLLIRGDDATASSLRSIPDQDFSRIQGDDEAMVQAATTVADAHRQLLQEIGSGGQPVLIERTMRTGVTRESVLKFVRTLSPQLIEEASRRWFRPTAVDATPLTTPGTNEASSLINGLETGERIGDSLLSDDLSGASLLSDSLIDDDLGDESLLSPDALSTDPLSVEDPLGEDLRQSDLGSSDSLASDSQPEAFDSERLLPAGGWYVDDLRASIRYRGSGHDDPVLKSVIELVRQLPESDRARKALLQTRAIRSCLQCHPGAVSSRASWVSQPLVGRRDQLTKFSHRSHINVAQLADCQHCHQIRSSEPSDVRLVASGDADRPEFTHLSKQSCVACHVPKAAGDNCTTCHRYHVEDAASFRILQDPFALR